VRLHYVSYSKQQSLQCSFIVGPLRYKPNPVLDRVQSCQRDKTWYYDKYLQNAFIAHFCASSAYIQIAFFVTSPAKLQNQSLSRGCDNGLVCLASHTERWVTTNKQRAWNERLSGGSRFPCGAPSKENLDGLVAAKFSTVYHLVSQTQ
jgi:hypothetical protein